MPTLSTKPIVDCHNVNKKLLSDLTICGHSLHCRYDVVLHLWDLILLCTFFSAYRKALAALDQSRTNVAEMKDTISTLRHDLQRAVENTEGLLNNLVAKATLRERLKAKLDVGNSSLKAFMALIDSEMEDDETDSILLDDYDELDEEYEKIKSAQSGSRKVLTLDENIEQAEETLKIAREKFDKASAKVGF